MARKPIESPGSRLKSTGLPAKDFLLIGGGFFNYAKEITTALEARGRHCVWFEDRPSLSTYTKSMLRIAPALVSSQSDSYFASIRDQIQKMPIRDVLIIKAEAMSPLSISRLRATLPQARFVLYFWDSYRNMPRDSFQKVSEFDKAFTFDPEDAASDPRLEYRPLFFIDEYATINTESSAKDIDLLFVGTAHSDRYKIIRCLAESLPTYVHAKFILYFPSRLIFLTRQILDSAYWKKRRAEFVFKPLSKTEMAKLIVRSRAILDIERTVQCGLTMRTIEVFGARRKLITTNAKVQEADIYDPRNIAVIDREHPKIDWEFLRQPYSEPDLKLLERYSLNGWIRDVLGA